MPCGQGRATQSGYLRTREPLGMNKGVLFRASSMLRAAGYRNVRRWASICCRARRSSTPCPETRCDMPALRCQDRSSESDISATSPTVRTVVPNNLTHHERATGYAVSDSHADSVWLRRQLDVSVSVKCLSMSLSLFPRHVSGQWTASRHTLAASGVTARSAGKPNSWELSHGRAWDAHQAGQAAVRP